MQHAVNALKGREGRAGTGLKQQRMRIRKTHMQRGWPDQEAGRGVRQIKNFINKAHGTRSRAIVAHEMPSRRGPASPEGPEGPAAAPPPPGGPYPVFQPRGAPKKKEDGLG